MTNPFAHEDNLIQKIKAKLKEAGESVWQRHPLPWSHPSFRSSPIAAQNLLRLFPNATAYLVMRDASLRAVREAVLRQAKTLVIPTRHGDSILKIPSNALSMQGGVLPIDPPPNGTIPYTGTIDVVVVSCLAFSKHQRRLYTFEDRTAHIIEELRDDLPSGWQLPASTPVVCVAADQQEVQEWPQSAQGCLEADLVVTPTRVIALGTGEEFLASTLKDQGPANRIGM